MKSSNSNLTLLAIDSSCEYLQLALSGPKGIQLSIIDSGLKHAERLVPAVKSMFSDAGCEVSELDAVICSSGPGSFTGLRIGMSAAKAIAAANNIPLISVPTLEAMALAHADLQAALICALDARKQRYYAAAFNKDGKRPDVLPADADISSQDLLSELLSWESQLLPSTGSGSVPLYICGPHSEKLVSELTALEEDGDGQAKTALFEPTALQFRQWAGALIELGRIKFENGEVDDDSSGPNYLRLSEAELGITRSDK